MIGDPKRISIFVAGATVLDKERKAFKAIANDLNGELEQHGFHISMRSYDNFRENQAEYNDYIQNTADLVIFVLDGRIGAETLNEFKLANNSLKQSGRPRIIVFLREFTELTPDISFIQGLLTATTQEYWITYKDGNDLVLKAEKRIRKFISSREWKVNKKPTLSRFRPALFYLLFAFAFLCLIAAGGFCYNKVFRSGSSADSAAVSGVAPSDTVLLIVGGGSAFNSIVDSIPGIYNYPNAALVHMRSSHALNILQEEVRPDSARRYNPIIFSAEERDQDFFTNSWGVGPYQATGRIIAYKFNEDPLTIDVGGLENEPRIAQYFEGSSISAADLRKIIKDRKNLNIRIFATSKGSGTLDRYEESDVLGFGLDESEYTRFSEQTRSGEIQGTLDYAYIVLGSKYYRPADFMSGKSFNRSYTVTFADRPDVPVTKPIYIYFMAHKVNDDIIEIKPTLLKFFKKYNLIKDIDRINPFFDISSQSPIILFTWEQLISNEHPR